MNPPPGSAPIIPLAISTILAFAVGFYLQKINTKWGMKSERAKAIEGLLCEYENYAIRYWTGQISTDERGDIEREIKRLRRKIGQEITGLKKRLRLCSMTRSSLAIRALHKVAAGGNFECRTNDISLFQDDKRANNIQELSCKMVQALRDDLKII